jgi:hypothetical protein
MNASPPRVFYWFWFTRLILAGCAGFFGLFTVVVVVAVIIAHVRGTTTIDGPGAVMLTLTGLFGAVMIGWFFASLRAGKLTIAEDRVIIPRLQLPPWCFFKPHEIVFRHVKRFGIGEVVSRAGAAAVLMFEVVIDERSEATRRYRTSLIWYGERQEILEAVTQGIGREPEPLEQTLLGDVRFKA